MKKKTIHPFKALFIGSGNIVLRHINSLRKLKNIEFKNDNFIEKLFFIDLFYQKFFSVHKSSQLSY